MALDLTDKTSNGNDLTNSGVTEETTIVPAGLSGATNSAKFVRSESDYAYITDANQTGLGNFDNFTFEGWIYLNTAITTTLHTIVDKVKTTDSNVEYIWFLKEEAGTDKMKLTISTSGSFQAGNEVGVDWSASTGTWYHVAVSYNGSNGEVKFYVNGSQQGSTQTVSTYGTIYNGDSAFALGINKPLDTPNSPLDGYLKDVRVWNDVRTQTEIDNNKGSFLGGDEAGLVAYYPFEALGGGGRVTADARATAAARNTANARATASARTAV